jgi:hypothetical protein
MPPTLLLAPLLYLGLTGATAPAATALPASTGHVARADTTCRAPDDRWALIIAGIARGVATQERHERARTRYGVERIDSAAVVVETDDAKCARAARLIADRVGVPVARLQPVLVRVGGKYWVEDPTVGEGEMWTFILDGEVTRILYSNFVDP